MSRGGFFLLAALAAALWLLQWISGTYGLMTGSPPGRVLDIAASIVGAAVVVTVVGWIVVELGLAVMLRIRPSGFSRTIVYGVLALAAIAWVLASFGVDLAAVITTSAVLAAVLGLALQPTLGGLIAGVSIHSERMVRLGDAIELDGGLFRVTGLGWRSITVDGGDGKRTMLPNAAIVTQTFKVFPATEPARLDSDFAVPLTIAPERLEALVLDLLRDIPGIEHSLPMSVTPLAYDMAAGCTRYRARYWIANVFDKTALHAEVLSRIWHSFQREQIDWPVPNWFEPRLHHWKVAEDVGGDVLLFAPGEPLRFPERCAGGRFRLMRGTLQATAPGDALSHLSSHERQRAPLERETALRHVALRLAHDIGPYAELAVNEAALQRAHVGEIIDQVAGEIDDDAARARFIADLPRDDRAPIEAGLAFGLRRDGAGRIVSDPPMRALTHVRIVFEPADPAPRADNGTTRDGPRR